ncbi:MAG: hypothetical protein WDA22_16935 [Bacteroidota bacterium]
MKTFLKYVLLFFIFFTLVVLPVVFIPVTLTVENQSDYNAHMIVLFLLIQFSTIIYLIKRLNLWGGKLFFSTVIIFWGLQTFMTQVETWYFRDAMPAITNSELLNLFLRPLITAITFVPLAMWILGKWKQNVERSAPQTQLNRSTLQWKDVLWLSATYVIIYFVFGFFVAWQFEAVRLFYSGSTENAGFIGQIQQTLQTKSFIFPFQFFRGFLWIMIGFPIVMYLKGSKKEKILACVILYSLPAIQLIVDNPFMPQPVRLAHLLEVSTSNGLFGLLIGYVSTRKV